MACDKVTYNSFEEAQRVVNAAAKAPRFYHNGKRMNRRVTYKPKRAYKCPNCGMYHLTSKKEEKRRNKGLKPQTGGKYSHKLK